MQRIAELRKAKRWNQVALALKLNSSQYLVSAYETGRHQPSIETLKELSKLFNVSVDYIIENTDIKTPVNAFYDGDLTSDEAELLLMFRELGKSDRERAIKILAALKQ